MSSNRCYLCPRSIHEDASTSYYSFCFFWFDVAGAACVQTSFVCAHHACFAQFRQFPHRATMIPKSHFLLNRKSSRSFLIKYFTYLTFMFHEPFGETPNASIPSMSPVPSSCVLNSMSPVSSPCDVNGTWVRYYIWTHLKDFLFPVSWGVPVYRLGTWVTRVRGHR